MSGDPNDFSEKCLAMYTKDGLWVDRDCNSKMHGLCQGAPTIVRPTGMPPPELEGTQNAGLKAALAIFILSTIGLVVFMKRDRLQLEFRKIRKKKPDDPNPLPDDQAKEEEKFLSAEERKFKEEIMKLQSEVGQKDQQINELAQFVKEKTSSIEQELEEMKTNHQEEIKVLMEKYEENIKQTMEQHEKLKRDIEIRMKDNKQQIENLEKELGNKNEKKTKSEQAAN